MTVGAPDASRGLQVRLPDFEGPFDLLLHLVRRGEPDVSTMPPRWLTNTSKFWPSCRKSMLRRQESSFLVASLLVDLKVKRLEAEFGRRSPEADPDA